MKVFFQNYPLIVVIVLYFVLLSVLKTYLPEPEKLVKILTEWYQTYGYILVFFAAVLEGTFVVSLYVPGSTAILLGAAVSRTGVIYFPYVVILATIGLVIGYCINYALGRYGWYHALSKMGLEKGIVHAKEKLHSHKKKTIFFGYMHPGSASFISTAAGLIKLPFWEFLLLSIVSQLVWSLIWGGLAYLIGMSLVELFINYFSIAVLLIVFLWAVVYYLKKRKQKN